jgi:PAS domain S-box-containing protein
MFFITSMMVMVEGRRAALEVWLGMSAATLACFWLVAFEVKNVPLLITAILARQGLVLVGVAKRRKRPLVAAVIVPANLVVGGASIYLVVTGRAELFVPIMLSGLFFVAAMGFWFHGWRRSLALHVMAASLMIWSLSFLLRPALHALWPGLMVDEGFWNVALWFVAGGMIVMVLEEAAWHAKEQAEEYRLAFESNPHPLWIYDVNSFRILDANQGALDLHGYTRAEFLELRLQDILTAYQEAGVRRSIASGETVHAVASMHVRKDRTTVPIDVTAHEITFKGKKCRFVLGLDASVRSALEEKIVRQ